AARSATTVAGDRGDRGAAHLTDAAVSCVRDKQVTRAVERDAGRIKHIPARRRAAVSAIAADAGAGYGRDRAAAHLSYAAVVCVSDIKVVRAVKRDSAWTVERSAGRRTAVTPVPTAAVAARAGHRRDRAATHLTDATVQLVPDIEVAAAV